VLAGIENRFRKGQRVISKRAIQHVLSFDRDFTDLLADGEMTRIWIVIAEPEAQSLVAGIVPEAVREQARMALEPIEITVRKRKQPKGTPA
jgi:hypothetical protein